MNLETKIPPPAICFICALLMYISAQVSALADIMPRFPILLSVVLMAFGTLLGIFRCVGVSPCAHDRQPVQPRTNRTLRFRRRVPFQPQPDVCRHGLLAGRMGRLFGAPAAVVVFGCICCLYDTLSNHARRTHFGAEIRCRIRVLLSARSPLVIRRGSFQSSITRLLLYGMNVNT